MEPSTSAARLIALALLLFALVLFSLVTPRLLSAVAAIPGDSWIRRVQDGGTLTERQLGHAAVSRYRALGWTENGRHWSDLALLEMIGEEQGTALDTTAAMALAAPAAERRPVELLRRGLVRAPARPFAWTRLSIAQSRAGSLEKSVAALAMSLDLAPYSRRLRDARIGLALTHWQDLEPDLKARMAEQVALAWQSWHGRHALVEQVSRAGLIPNLRLALLPDIDRLVELERILARKASQ